MLNRLLGRRCPTENKVPQVVDEQPANPFTELQVLSGHTDIVRYLLPLDHYRFVSAGDDGTIIVWNFQTGERLCVLHGHTRPISALATLSCPLNLDLLDPHPLLLLSASSDRTICMWDMESQSLLKALGDHSCSVKCLLVLRREDLWLAGGSTLLLWNRVGELLCKVMGHLEEDICSMIEIADSRVVAAVGKDLAVYRLAFCSFSESTAQWGLRELAMLQSHSDDVRSLLHVSDGCFVSGSLSGEMVVWSGVSLVALQKIKVDEDTPGKCLEHNSQLYPTGIYCLSSSSQLLFAAVGCGVCVYDLVTQRVVAWRSAAHGSRVTAIIGLRDSDLLVSSSEDGTAHLWKLQPYTPQGAFMSYAGVFNFLRGSGFPAQVSMTNRWNLELEGDLVGHSGAVEALLDLGTWGLVTCSADHLLIIWRNGDTWPDIIHSQEDQEARFMSTNKEKV
uniref:WD repeat-containing protein 41-like isoform X1 n=1 Tax=Myxine glutinosa TaxID=7769 RepID=UPI00358FE3AB